MGNFASKLLGRYAEEVTESKAKSTCSEETAPCTPATVKKTVPMDPRSASAGIPRTPIEIIYTPPTTQRRPISAIPPYLQKKQYLETDFDDIATHAPRKGSPTMPPATGILSIPDLNGSPNVNKMNRPTINVVAESPLAARQSRDTDTLLDELRYRIFGLDPRSPAADFSRTPILSPKSIRRLKARSFENLNRRDSYLEMNIPSQTRLSYCETTAEDRIVEVLALPDIALNQCTASSLHLSIKNLDICDSGSTSSDTSIETIYGDCDEVTVIPNPNVKLGQGVHTLPVASSSSSSIEVIDDYQDVSCPAQAETEDYLHSPAENVNRVLSIATKAHEKQKLVTEVERRVSVWMDSISSEVLETQNCNVPDNLTPVQTDVNSLPNEEVLIEFDDNEIMKPKITQATNVLNETEKPKVTRLEMAGRKNNNLEIDSKVFFQEKIFTPDGKNINQAPKVRTPLGNRSNNHVKVKNMAMKSPQQLLRGKVMSTKLHQENTPPRSIKSKLNSTQWDPDSTFLI
ncbi:uncharacterized protein LOC124302019 [Neodiprion virginianus]|uniref:uncharacterized protein LOC124302019 n=1 Tax=Neodiprion virginianus TaxID=2961670 RepID=UPI001EE734F1|nr:uncharacterized protein LOC124302019 [Neodiprion virginianus]XP_046613717.1 uncharacterized protein LOC124302019 [Neodiprion virginianus]XP_046613718.1 uncharacterized protein LOC124302019 [Neodiprion virginianus]XP_046613719.1 uncharacterized protein LOC124302019 [Neodiprion virginianus]